MSSEHIP